MQTSHLIFGGAGGIGLATARLLAAEGARPVLASRDRARLEAAGLPFVECDATSGEQVERAIEFCRNEMGGCDGIVNCAGSIVLKPAHQTSDAEWQAVLATNLTTAFNVVRAGAKAMLRTGGSIVLVSTAAARTGIANHEAIAAAKAGVIGLTQSAAATYAKQNIRVNCVAPGLVRTPLSARITGNEASLKASEAMHALGRIGEPEDVASAIVWLLKQSWVSGQVLGVDGGLATLRPR